MPDGGEITQLLAEKRAGSVPAMERLIPIVYQELRRLAAYHMQQERSGHTLQATALVHEVYLRLAGPKEQNWHNRAHFFAVAAQIMRNLLVDHARGRNRLKRGGGTAVALDEALMIPVSEELLAIHDALDELAGLDDRQAQIVEMRYFTGMSVEEVALMMGISERTVKREWQMAKAWLYDRVRGDAQAAG
jgi:RNA polymerase sigma-70 factor, ECF subfamily